MPFIVTQTSDEPNEARNAKNAIIEYALQRAGQEGVAEARQGHSYIDRTGNLTASIAAGTSEGGVASATNREGERYLAQAMREQKSKHFVVLSAGMEYAASVAARGYNVIESGAQAMRRTLNEILTEFIKR